MIAIPKKATTVILLKENESNGFEIFLLKRHEKSSFMGGNFVYPGGRVDPDDGGLEICSFCNGITPEEAHQMFGGSMPPDQSFGHYIAGIRELFVKIFTAFLTESGFMFLTNRRRPPIRMVSRLYLPFPLIQSYPRNSSFVKDLF